MASVPTTANAPPCRCQRREGPRPPRYHGNGWTWGWGSRHQGPHLENRWSKGRSLQRAEGVSGVGDLPSLSWGARGWTCSIRPSWEPRLASARLSRGRHAPPSARPLLSGARARRRGRAGAGIRQVAVSSGRVRGSPQAASDKSAKAVRFVSMTLNFMLNFLTGPQAQMSGRG